jgi:hypothetical protein
LQPGVFSFLLFLFFLFFFFKWRMGTVVIMAIHGSQIILPYILCYDYILLFTLVWCGLPSSCKHK